jgi:hypothetical protein
MDVAHIIENIAARARQITPADEPGKSAAIIAAEHAALRRDVDALLSLLGA